MVTIPNFAIRSADGRYFVGDRRTVHPCLSRQTWSHDLGRAQRYISAGLARHAIYTRPGSVTMRGARVVAI
jgi:hypothetical protein